MSAANFSLAAALLDTLTRATSSSNVVVKPTTAPLLPSPNVVGKVGNALTFEMGAVAANPVTYTMTGAPAGMTLSAAGRVTWPRPVFGNHTVKVTAKDSRTGLTGSGTATVGIAGNPPVVTAATVSGREGTALSSKAVVKSVLSLVCRPLALAVIESELSFGDPAVVRGAVFELLRTGQLMAPSLHTQPLSMHTMVEPAI